MTFQITSLFTNSKMCESKDKIADGNEMKKNYYLYINVFKKNLNSILQFQQIRFCSKLTVIQLLLLIFIFVRKLKQLSCFMMFSLCNFLGRIQLWCIKAKWNSINVDICSPHGFKTYLDLPNKKTTFAIVSHLFFAYCWQVTLN